MSHPVLEAQLKQGLLKPVYLFYGEEDFLIQRAIRRLEKFLAERLGEPPLKILREAQEVGLAEVLAEARVPPLWGVGQLLVLRGVEAYPEKALKALLPYLDHPGRQSWLVLTAAGLKTKEVEKSPVFGRLAQEQAALAFRRLREEELYRWLVQEAKKSGKTLTLAAAQNLVEIAGDNLADLSQELDKLLLFAGDALTVGPQLVAQLACHSRTYNIFALVDALGERQPQKRLTALAHLLDTGEAPPLIVSMLARQVRLLIQVKEATPDEPLEVLAGRLKLPTGVVKNLARQARAFSVAALQQHLKLLHQVDYYLKTSTANPRLWLEWAVLRMGPN